MTRAELETILREYGGTLSRFCFSLCKNEADADDLYQDTCIKLLKSDFVSHSQNETLSFIYKTCLNAFRNTYKAMRRKKEAEITGLSKEYVENLPDKTADDQTYEDLYIAVNSLPYKYKTVLTLIYFEDMTEAEAAAILGVPQGTVKSRLFKAKQLLKKELERK